MIQWNHVSSLKLAMEWWKYLYHGNWQMLKIKAFFSHKCWLLIISYCSTGQLLQKRRDFISDLPIWPRKKCSFLLGQCVYKTWQMGIGTGPFTGEERAVALIGIYWVLTMLPARDINNRVRLAFCYFNSLVSFSSHYSNMRLPSGLSITPDSPNGPWSLNSS